MGWPVFPRVPLSYSNLNLIVTFSNFYTKMLTRGELKDFLTSHVNILKGLLETTSSVVFPTRVMTLGLGLSGSEG